MPVRVKQHDITDCGAACIASVAAHYKLLLPVSRIRQLAATDRKGTSVSGLLGALRELGFEAKGVRGDMTSLFSIPKPAITHVMPSVGLHHYVVVYGVTSTHIEIMDPADGLIHHYLHDDFIKIWTGVIVILLPGNSFRERNEVTSSWLRFWRLLRPHKSVMIQALFGALFFTIIGLTTSIYVQKIVDYVLTDGNANLLNLMSIIMIALLIVQTLIGLSKGMMILDTGQQIDVELILGYYKHLLKLPQTFFDKMRIGEITSRISDAIKIRVFVNDIGIALAVNVFIVLFSFVLMFTYYWRLALVMFLIIPLYAIIYFVADMVNKKIERRMMEHSADLESQLVESLSAIHTIKTFGIEQFVNQKTEGKFISVLKSVYKSGVNSISIGGMSESLARLFTIILLWVGASFALRNEITPGELLSFYALLGYFTGPAGMVISTNKTIQNALIAADRLFEIMDLETEKNNNNIVLGHSDIGDIVYRNIYFTYDKEITVFRDFNLRISGGKITALVGESGSGKSTLVSLLQNLYQVQSGAVLIGSYEVKYIEKDSLRDLIGIVPQKIDLFAGSIIDNIALGSYEPDLGRIIGICSSLNMLDFIEQLPNGFNTYIGENGSSLSGGQRQRIAIARALYKDPEILILDEATSSLDSGAEQYVHSAIEMMKERSKTVIIVAHRLSTVHRADKIVVLQNGCVVEEGRHKELIDKKQHYYQMWKQQFGVDEGIRTPEVNGG